VLGWCWVHYRPGRSSRGWTTPLSGSAGFPDIVAVRGARVVFIELKSETGRLTDSQAAWLLALGQAGAEVHCWRPSDWPEVEEILR
jgi:hypothetical protein